MVTRAGSGRPGRHSLPAAERLSFPVTNDFGENAPGPRPAAQPGLAGGSLPAFWPGPRNPTGNLKSDYPGPLAEHHAVDSESVQVPAVAGGGRFECSAFGTVQMLPMYTAGPGAEKDIN